MLKTQILRLGYKGVIKPWFFLQDAEAVHNRITNLGEKLGGGLATSKLTNWLFSYSNPNLETVFDGIKFPNRVGLSAGFDYDGHLAKIAKFVGFGFNTVGTVTAKPYGGNSGIRLGRLPKSKSLFVNKGFKNEGVRAIAERLDKMGLGDHVVGVSIGSSNLPEINTVDKAIADCCASFRHLKDKEYIKYFELNISCPNLKLAGTFTSAANLGKLLSAISKLKIKQPIYLKMPNEISLADSDALVELSLKNGVSGFIFSNLVKDRNNKHLDRRELEKFANLPGNFSGRPTFDNSNSLITHTRQKFGKHFTIVGCGGIFSAEDAIAKFRAGANLVQLITGMVFEGPQIVGEINRKLAGQTSKLFHR